MVLVEARQYQRKELALIALNGQIEADLSEGVLRSFINPRISGSGLYLVGQQCQIWAVSQSSPITMTTANPDGIT